MLDSKTGDPVFKATIILRQGQEGGIATTSGRDGKFAFRDIDPGAYIIAAERDGYAIAQRKPQAVDVEVGQDTSGVELKMVRTGVISGRVLDGDGDPVVGANVMISPFVATTNRAATRYSSTNDRGEYRAFDIAPGEYRISVAYAPRNRLVGVRMQRPKDGDTALSGDAYPVVYYPATTDQRQAAAVKVEPGAELNGFDLQLIKAHGVRIRGRVNAVAGGGPAPLFQIVHLAPIGAPNGPGQPHEFVIRDSKGEFELDDVLPGRYRLQVDGAGLADSGRTTARLNLDVGTTDINGIELTPVPPQHLSGTIAVPEGRKLPNGLMVVLVSRQREDTQEGGIAQVQADGTFKFPEVQAGDYDLVLGSISGGDDTYIQSIRAGDADLLAEGLHVGETPAGPVQIVLNANGAALQCTVTGENGEPVPGAKVVLAPDPPKERQAALFGECEAQADGACKIQGIAPGEYHVYAFAPDTEIKYHDPDALKAFEKSGQALKFAEGDRKMADLKPAQAPEIQR